MADDRPQYRNFFLYVGILILAAIVILFIFSSNNTKVSQDVNETVINNTDSKMLQKTYPQPPALTIDVKKNYSATLETSKGAITVELFANEVPNTVNNFVFLAKAGFYNGTTFHRIVKDFMIQGGDPKGDGTGGPGYRFADEKITRDYKRGIIAMANSGPNTNGSQFFIMHKDSDLPKNYVIFGQVTRGIEVVDKIAQTPTVEGPGGEQSKPTEKIIIEKMSITES